MIHRVESMLRALGSEMLHWRREGQVSYSRHGHSVSSDADQRAHRFLSRELADIRPGIPIISEEDPSGHGFARPALYWLIDPIDGTASYCEGFDGFVCQVALVQDGEPVMGVVRAPALDLTWSAEKHGEALCNGARVSVKPAGSERTLIDNYPQPRGCALRVYRECGFTRYVESGSIGLKICRVADGIADLFVKDVTVRDWDVAPAHLVLNRAGGQLRTFDGAEYAYEGSMEKAGLIASANPGLLQEIVDWRSERRS